MFYVTQSLTWVLNLNQMQPDSRSKTRVGIPVVGRYGCLCCPIGLAVWPPRHLYDSSLIPEC